MRTKSLVLASLLGLASIASVSAQVYSVNAVGFVNVTVPTGFSLIANPLNAPVNTLAGVLNTVPDGTVFYKFENGAYKIYTFDLGEWDNPNISFAPGEGGFIRNASGQPFTVTFVGEVPQGTDLKTPVPAGFSIKASIVPQELVLSDSNPPAGVPNLNFPATDGDIIYFYRSGGYRTHIFDLGEWDSPPIPKVGESFFVRTSAAKPNGWSRSFSVNN